MEFTEAERTQMLAQLDGQLSLLEARRSFAPDWELQPAHVFRPDLPGHKGPAKAEFVPRQREVEAPGSATDVAFASLYELSHWLRTKQLSSLELTDLYLSRLEKHGSKLECVVSLTPELARAQAKRADEEIAAGKTRGPLHGIPWGAKDLLDTKGLSTTWGATPFKDRVAKVDAAVVERLEAAGAVLVAKLSLGALAYGDVWFGGKTRNPWNLDEGSSGSSAGSASAVVAGLVGFAIGSETLGSIVAPSTRCGAAGFRPSFGRVSRYGAMPLAWSLDKLGPLCRHAEDCALVFSAIDGPDPRDASTRTAHFAYRPEPKRRFRVAYDESWFQELDPEYKKALDGLADQGIELVERKWPELTWDALLVGLFGETSAALESLTRSGQDDQLVWQDDVAWPNTLRSSWFIPAGDLVQADRLRRRAMELACEAFQDVDAWVSASQGDPMLVATNYVGTPSLTVRAGFSKHRARELSGEEAKEGDAREVPFSLTFWGGLDEDGGLIELGERAEAAWRAASKRPPSFV
jgi:Asp-tRNA(Asn)/Glu-tRNA(Gln) amidotransferase A subunit family amidase